LPRELSPLSSHRAVSAGTLPAIAPHNKHLHMREISILILTMIVFSCAQNGRELNVDAKINIIKLKQGKGIIFPASYSNKIFKNSLKVKGVFTPDEKTIRAIDKNLEFNFQPILNSYQRELKSFAVFEKDLDKYDKQFLGYINSNHDSIIFVTVYNFDSDPLNLKQRIEKEYLGGADGWNDTNVFEFTFNKKSRKYSNAYE
jgi:hypothetical protein